MEVTWLYFYCVPQLDGVIPDPLAEGLSDRIAACNFQGSYGRQWEPSQRNGFDFMVRRIQSDCKPISSGIVTATVPAAVETVEEMYPPSLEIKS